MNDGNLASFTDILDDEVSEIANSQESQPLSIPSENSQLIDNVMNNAEIFLPSDKDVQKIARPPKGTGQHGQFRSVEEIDIKYRSVFSYPYFNLVQSSVIEDALYSDKSMVVCAPTGSGKTVVFEMAIVQLLMEMEDKQYTEDYKIIYMAPVKALCTERLTEWYPKFTKYGLLCIEVTGDTDVDFSQLKPYRIIITTPEKWDMVTRRWREHSQLVEVIKLFLIDEVHILNDEARGPVLEAVVSRMKTIEVSAQSVHRIEKLQNQYQGTEMTCKETPPKIRFVAVSATVGNPGDVALWLGTPDKPAVFYKFGDECRPVKLKRVVEGYPCPEGTSIFKFDIILNYKLWPVIQKYHDGKPTLIFCNTRKSVQLTAETLSRELTVTFSPEQKAKLTALASGIKNRKLQMLVLSGVGCHHAGLLYEERTSIEHAFRNRDLPILITTTTLAMGVNLPAHLVIVKNTQQYVNGAYQEYSISTILQMVGRAGRPQFDTEATAVIMTRLCDKARYQALVGGSEPLQSYLHKRLTENLNSEVALRTVTDVAQCVQWVRSTFLSVRAARDPKRYLGLPQTAPQQLISKKIEELCVKAINGLASSGLITMDEACCIESTEAGRLMSIFYLDLETMKHIMKINGDETLERLLWIICESHELADMHLRVDERRCLNTLNRNNAAATIRFPMKGKISTRQMKLSCIIQAILGCLNIPDPSLNQEAMKIMRLADRVCKCLVAYLTRPALISQQSKYYSAVLNGLILAKCIAAHLWENSIYVSKQLKGIGPTFSTLLATAGKVNFLLLEESHPRDLERIMNKGPPAGNILRKQISLLPKYQLTLTPIDEKAVTIQLTLLNQNYLSENMEQLTAGSHHKSYLVVGDSENNLLLLTSFKDSDLIRIYDGIMTYQITRKNSFEHKVFVHCISSSYVGIDAQSEYLFKDLEAVYPSHNNTTLNNDFIRKSASKQTYITDTFKERKRKHTSENDITQSKEKKKRDNALLDKFKSLKDSFGKTSKELKKDLDKSAMMSNKILQELTQSKIPVTFKKVVSEHLNETTSTESPQNYPNDIPMIDLTNTNSIAQINYDEKSVMSSTAMPDITQLKTPVTYTEAVSEYSNKKIAQKLPENYSSISQMMDLTDVNSIEHLDYSKNPDMDDEQINSILYEIENEISKNNKVLDLTPVDINTNKSGRYLQSSVTSGSSLMDTTAININLLSNVDKTQTTLNAKKRAKKSKRSKCNFDSINKYICLSDDEDENYNDSNQGNVFSDIVKTKIDKYLQHTTHTKQTLNKSVVDLLNKKDNEKREEIKSDENSKIESVIKDVNVDVSSSKVHDKINALEGENNTDFEKYTEQKSIVSKSTKEEAETVKRLLQSEIYETNTEKSVASENLNEEDKTTKYFVQNDISETNRYSHIINNDFVDAVPDHSLDSNTNMNQNSPLAQSVSPLKNEIDFPASIHEKINAKYQTKNHSATQLVQLTQNLIRFPTSLHQLPYTRKHVSQFPDSLQTERQILCQNNTLYSRTDAKRSQLDLYHSEPKQYNGKSSQDNPNSNSEPGLSNHNTNIRKYTYSATKIDVATRKEFVTIIRKIKMEVDITEITDQKENRQYTKKIKKEDKENCINNGEMKSTDFEQHDKGNDFVIAYSTQPYTEYCNNVEKHSHSYEPEVKCIDFHTLEPHVEKEEYNGTIRVYDKKQSTYNSKADENYTNESNTAGIDFEMLDSHVEDETKNTTLTSYHTDENYNVAAKNNIQDNFIGQNNSTIHTLSTYTALFSSEPRSEPITKSSNLQSDYTTHKVSREDTAEKSTEKTKSPQKGSLGSIFQKYSKILRKDSIGNLSQTPSQAKDKGNSSNNPPPERTKRPFKITEIQNLKIPLSKLQFSETVKRGKSDETIDTIPNRENMTEIQIPEESYKDFTDTQTAIPYKSTLSPTYSKKILKDFTQISNGSILLNEDIENNMEEQFSAIEELEPCAETNTDDFDIDQSMFNPMTLIKCFGKDDDSLENIVIPPPPEFCNEPEVSPQDNVMPIDCYEPTKWDSDYIDKISESISQDDSNIELMSDNEIETWALSQNDEDILQNPAFNSRQSFTTLHTPKQLNTVIQNVSVSSQKALGQFKYNRKKTLSKP